MPKIKILYLDQGVRTGKFQQNKQQNQVKYFIMSIQFLWSSITTSAQRCTQG